MSPRTEKPLTKNIDPAREPMGLRDYERAGGYEGLRRALQMTPAQVQEQVDKSTVLGRGGAGFSAGEKWSHVPMGEEARRPKYLAVNADEMEPGSMKDRILMEGDPHQLVEGVIISCYALEASEAYIFLRREYDLSAERLEKAIAEAREAGYIGRKVMGSDFAVDVHLHRSAGRYMCGEAAAMLNAIEGKRAIPRSRPPHMAQVGLWGKPTVVNNVETICCVPHIVLHGWEWFMGLSYTGEGGTKLYGASGPVKRPGVWELPMGTTARELLEGYAGGMADGRTLKGWLPGGASTAFLTAEHLDVKMDFASVAAIGSHLGTGTMVIMDDRTCPVGTTYSLELFFARESCGWCTPCREGLPWVVQVLEALEEGRGELADLDILDDHIRQLKPGNTFCGLAPAAMEPLAGALKYFRADFERHVHEKHCPWR